MQMFLAAVIFLAFVITGGSSLTCEKCYKDKSESCSGIFRLCQKGVTHCVSGLRNKTTGRKVILTAFKNCLKSGKQATCGKEVVVTGAEFFFQITRKCCDSDKCNREIMNVPPVNRTLNGYKCPTCYKNRSSDECKSVADNPCVGKEDKCASYIRSSSKPGNPHG
ncbi:phospholipase A2 inhibitor gamma subunit A-like [Lissotriton helveticus]